MLKGIIKGTTQFPDGSPIEPKCVLSKWSNDCGALARENVRSPGLIGDIVPVNEKEALWDLIMAHPIVPSEQEEHGKRATILTIGRALRRFRHALNKFYVQPDVSPFNRFGFITPNEWNTFQQLHTTSEAMVRSNRIKELI
jgi:hypothetical protein